MYVYIYIQLFGSVHVHWAAAKAHIGRRTEKVVEGMYTPLIPASSRSKSFVSTHAFLSCAMFFLVAPRHPVPEAVFFFLVLGFPSKIR